jgi:hypothetical protein
MRNRLMRFGAFWYDFVVGDDWRLAAGVVLALALTAVVAALTSVAAWWIGITVVMCVLVASVWHAVGHCDP